jgi:hypothetical protein
MYQIARKPVAVALTLMMLLLLGSVAAEARDTNGSDRLVKGAAIGAAVGAVTQVVRGRRSGPELLKGAGVGAAVGAAVGAYSDYQQEKDARVDAERRADYRRYRGYRSTRGGYRDGFYAPDYSRQGRAFRAAHRHNGRCRHR